MPDGPNHYELFQKMQCLNVETNLKEILQWLRFSKSEGNYQMFLRHYLPMLATPETAAHFKEFAPDLEDKNLAKELKKGLKDTEEPTDTVKEEIAEEPKVEKKK